MTIGSRMILRRSLAIVTVLFLTSVPAREPARASAHAPGDQPAKVAVTIDNFNYGPSTVTIPAGTTVVWTNQDDVPHTVTSDDKVFASPVLDTGEKFEYTFRKPGTFPYYCTVHPKMTGKVVVQ